MKIPPVVEKDGISDKLEQFMKVQEQLNKKLVEGLTKKAKNIKGRLSTPLFDDDDNDNNDYSSFDPAKISRKISEDTKKVLGVFKLDAEKELESLEKTVEANKSAMRYMAREMAKLLAAGHIKTTLGKGDDKKVVDIREQMERLQTGANELKGWRVGNSYKDAKEAKRKLVKSGLGFTQIPQSAIDDLEKKLNLHQGTLKLNKGAVLEDARLKQVAEIYAKEIEKRFADQDKISVRSGQTARYMTLLLGGVFGGPLGVGVMKFFGIDKKVNKTIQNLTVGFLSGTGKFFSSMRSSMADAWEGSTLNSYISKSLDWFKNKMVGDDGKPNMLGSAISGISGFLKSFGSIAGLVSDIIMPAMSIMLAGTAGAMLGRWLGSLMIGGKSIQDWVTDGFSAAHDFFYGVNKSNKISRDTSGLIGNSNEIKTLNSSNLAGGVGSATFRAQDFQTINGMTPDSMHSDLYSGANGREYRDSGATLLNSGDTISTKLGSDISNAASSVGVDPNLMLGMARQESGFGRHQTNKNSSARGIFQITNHKSRGADGKMYDGLWDTTVKRHNLGKDYSNFAVDSLDPAKNAVVAAYVMKDWRIDHADPAYAYMTWFLGPLGAGKFMDALNKRPYESAASLFPEAAKANPTIFYNKSQGNVPYSLADVHQILANSMSSAYVLAGAPVSDNGTVNLSKMRTATSASTSLNINTALPSSSSAASSNYVIPSSISKVTKSSVPNLIKRPMLQPVPINKSGGTASINSGSPSLHIDNLDMYVADTGLMLVNSVGAFM